MPALSVILPVFNCEKYVAKAIESILNQTFSDFELLIADDGSNDASKAIITHFAVRDTRIITAHNFKNEGKIKTTNRLFDLCKGDFVTVHDADDFSHTDRFEKQIALLRKDDTLIMCGTSFRVITSAGVFFKDIVMSDNFTEISNRIVSASQFHGPTMVLRKEFVKDGLYRSFFDGYNEDCDLAFRLIEKGRCINHKEILYTYRIVPNSLSKTITAGKKNLYKMAVTFYEQRKFCGMDDLMAARIDKAQEKLASFMKPYREDPSLIHRENASFLMYYQLNRSAIYSAWKACILKPFCFDNWRTLQHCIRKTLLGM